jgi:divalent metal cation (Fe/Co/Zn/Cd) transporter
VVSPWISLGVLAIAATFEGTSFRIAYREYRRVVRGRSTRLWDFIKASKDPALFSVLLEDSAALIGIGIAAAGVIAATFFQVTWADGVASIAIGLLLASVAFLLANETRSLIAGEAVARRSSWSDCERLYLGSVASPASTRWRLCILVPARFW